MLKYKLKKSNHTATSAVKLHKLDDTHPISTTWILSKDLNDNELKNLINDITNYVGEYGLNVEQIDNHHLHITGTAINFANALNVDLHQYSLNEDVYHASSELINLPKKWKGKIDNILGLDTSKVAAPYVKFNVHENIHANSNITAKPFDPIQLSTLYNFPTNLDGTGQKIGIIELGGGFVASDISTYFSKLGINATPNVTAVSIDGAVNNPSDTSGANVEVILDIEVIAAIVPKAAIYVYFAPNTNKGFYDAINAAINQCNIVSISWGGPESQWSSSTRTSFNNLFKTASTKNVTILAAAGDAGSGDGLRGNNVDFPASSPYVLACGGTALYSNDNVNISTEVVWDNNSSSATGGGISRVFPQLSYQNNITYPLNGMRGVPDVAAVADPNTGYILYSASEGGSIVVGGTSAVAPLWSGLLARINQEIGHAVGFVHPVLYNAGNVFHDITQGNNGAYSAGVGWDACTGLGTPNGQLILGLFNGVKPDLPKASFTANNLTVNFVDTSCGATNWLWDFGDGVTSTIQNPTHTYNVSGTFNVKLTVGNNAGTNSVVVPIQLF